MVVSRSKPNQQSQPEETRKNHDPHQASSVPKIHKENHKQHLAKRDQKSDSRIERPEINDLIPVVEVQQSEREEPAAAMTTMPSPSATSPAPGRSWL